MPNAKAARAVLADRGLGESVVSEAEGLLDEAFSLAEGQDDPDAAALAEAEDAMWSWYLEWGGIARVAIKNRRVLRSLGFLRRRSKSRPDDLTDEDVFGDAASSEPAESSPFGAGSPVGDAPTDEGGTVAA